jgi:phosphoribosyl 1,2-cyclic phosphodiesterase
VGHLSNHVMAEFLAEDLDSSTHNLVLGHLSEQNNHPAIVDMFASQALAMRGLRTRLVIATQDAPTEVFQF